MRVVAAARAKINLYLAVGAPRADGYHGVTTVAHTLELADEVIVRPGRTLSLTCEPDLGLTGPQNLAWRAARAAGEAFGREPDLEIVVRKEIPAQAGLGGGSADAAAVLRAATVLWDEDLESDRLRAAARRLGADVPFLLAGGAALLAGRGDEIVRVFPPLRAPVVVVHPMAPVSTAAAYRAFDVLQAGPVPSAERTTEALLAGDVAELARNLYNNLTNASIAVAPAVAEALREVRETAGILGAAVAGSGSAVFGIAADDDAAAAAAASIAERGWWARATRMAAGAADRVEEGS